MVRSAWMRVSGLPRRAREGNLTLEATINGSSLVAVTHHPNSALI